MKFSKYHALGNDYLVLSPTDFPTGFSLERLHVARICHRNFGVGSDGVLWGPLPSSKAAFALKIFNPDGSEAEKSGNGLRIFSRYLWDMGRVRSQPFAIETAGGVVQSQVHDSGRTVTVEMGSVSFVSDRIPVAGPSREVLRETITVDDRAFTFCAATIGNPHCVIPLPTITPELAKTYGPRLESHPFFPNRTNVQFMEVYDRHNIRLEIWERGAGYTLASGSSSSAAAAVARRLGLVESEVTVHMPGGTLQIRIAPDFSITMTGPVTKIADGTLSREAFESPTI